MEVASALERYPDRQCQKLCETLAEVTGIEADRIVCGNGSDELIALLCRALAGPGDEVIHVARGFLMYRIAALGAGATPVATGGQDLSTSVDAIIDRVGPRTKLVFVANPNNPTDSLLRRKEIVRLHGHLPPHVVLVLDAAYAEYVDDPDCDSGVELARSAGNVAVLRTFSKLHAIAALRIGWLYGPASLVQKLDTVRPPFNANAAAQAAAIASIKDDEPV
jgi:histidinol-phosphate aminotransferase